MTPNATFIDSVEVFPPGLMLRIWTAALLAIVAGSVVSVATHSSPVAVGAGLSTAALTWFALLGLRRRHAPIDRASVLTLTTTEFIVDRQLSGTRVSTRSIADFASFRYRSGFSSFRMPMLTITFDDGGKWRCAGQPFSTSLAEFAATLAAADSA